jgi:hypothetical protein
LFFLLSALGLLPELLFESEPKVDFCKTPVGEDPSCGLPSQPSLKRLRADELLQESAWLALVVKTSPKGPPIEVPQEIGIQLACFWLDSLWSPLTLKPICIGSNSRDNLNGEKASFSRRSEDDDDEKSDETIEIDIESWVQSDFNSSGQLMTEQLD